MEPILAWVFLAAVTERIIEVISKAIPAIDDVNLKQLNVKLLMALGVGLVFAFGAQLDFFKMIGVDFAWNYVGYILSAFFIMAGSNVIHDLISLINRSRDIEWVEEWIEEE